MHYVIYTRAQQSLIVIPSKTRKLGVGGTSNIPKSYVTNHYLRNMGWDKKEKNDDRKKFYSETQSYFIYGVFTVN